MKKAFDDSDYIFPMFVAYACVSLANTVSLGICNCYHHRCSFYLKIGPVNRRVYRVRSKILVGWSEAALMNSV